MHARKMQLMRMPAKRAINADMTLSVAVIDLAPACGQVGPAEPKLAERRLVGGDGFEPPTLSV